MVMPERNCLVTNAEKPFSVLLRFPKISYLTSKCLATSHGGLFDAYGECACTGKTISATIMQSVTNNTFFFSVFQHPCATCIFCIIHICLRAQSTLFVLVIDKYVNNIYCHASLKYNISKLMF